MEFFQEHNPTESTDKIGYSNKFWRAKFTIFRLIYCKNIEVLYQRNIFVATKCFVAAAKLL